MELSEEEKKQVKIKVDKLKASKFWQQTLPAWRPKPSFGNTMCIFGFFGIVFIGLGVFFYWMSDRIMEVEKSQYNRLGCTGDKTFCEFDLEIENEIVAPVYVYYQLDNFYQNTRRYVLSKNPS